MNEFADDGDDFGVGFGIVCDLIEHMTKCFCGIGDAHRSACGLLGRLNELVDERICIGRFLREMVIDCVIETDGLQLGVAFDDRRNDGIIAVLREFFEVWIEFGRADRKTGQRMMAGIDRLSTNEEIAHNRSPGVLVDFVRRVGIEMGEFDLRREIGIESICAVNRSIDLVDGVDASIEALEGLGGADLLQFGEIERIGGVFLDNC